MNAVEFEQRLINVERRFMSTKKIYTAAEAALEIGISKQTLVRWLKAGKIPAFKVGFGVRAEWRIEHDVLMAQKKHNVPAPEDKKP